MKKFLIILILLIIISGVVFFFGWIQIQLGPAEYGVIFTKTSGWENEVIHPGEFTWRISAIIPTNLRLYQYTIAPQSIEIRSEGELPSGNLYREYITGNAEFGFTVEANIQYELKPNELPSLAKNSHIFPSNIEDYYSNFKETLQAETENYLLSYLKSSSSSEDPSVLFSDIQSKLSDRLSEKYAHIDVISVNIKSASFPDFELYQRAKEIYFSVLETRQQATNEAAQSLSFDKVREENSLDLLKKYGQILADYPVLLDYFKLVQEEGIDPLRLNELR
jgi:hypothetical protein